jgi:ribokinase
MSGKTHLIRTIGEAMTLLRSEGNPIAPADAPRVATALRELGAGTILLKLGAYGTVVADTTRVTHHAAYTVRAVDTTAAGDTFNGALAVALAEGKHLAYAVDFANRAAALSVSRHGAQCSMPSRAELDADGSF